MALPIAAAVEHLVGLQAQAPLPPYLGLWSRLRSFDPHELGRMLTEREVVRLTLMRGTVHLVTVRDALWLRPLVEVAAVRGHSGVFGRRMGGAQPDAIAAAVRELLAEAPMTARELARRMVERGIGEDVEALANATRVHVALAQLPPRGVWGAGGQARYATLEDWTGRAQDPDPSPEDLVLRYLRAFGPATPMDAQNWSGLTRLTEVFDRLRPRLVVVHDEDGRELFDVPGSPRPPAGTPAPVRFLGEFDNVLLGHADRRRIIPEDFPWGEMLREGRSVSNVLVDGMLRAVWWIEREGRRRATLTVRAVPPLEASERAEVEEEAQRVLAFAAHDAAAHDVRFA